MDIGQLILNFILLTFLGLLIAFSPSLIIVNFLVTLKSDKPIRDTLILIAGVLLPLIIVLLICLLWFQPDASFKIRGSLDKINVPAIIDLLFGLSLLGFAAKRRFTKTAHKTSSAGLSDRAKKIMVSPWSIF